MFIIIIIYHTNIQFVHYQQTPDHIRLAKLVGT